MTADATVAPPRVAPPGAAPRTPASARLRSALVTIGTAWPAPGCGTCSCSSCRSAIVLKLFSVGNRGGETGGYAGGFTFDNYEGAFRNASPFVTSLYLSIAGTVLCLLIGLPLAYYIATRAGRRKSLLIVLLVVPFWTSFLIRTYSWLILLGRDGVPAGSSTSSGTRRSGCSARTAAVLLGLSYGYLPLMVFPMYVTLERMDRTLVEASKDLGAGRLGDLPPGHAADRPAGPDHRQHPRLHPDDGRVRHPADPRLRPDVHDRQCTSAPVLEFRDWPAGSAQAVGLIFIMFVTISFYLWFTNRGRQVREQSVL